ncbi:MAG TPA: flagellar hook-basal body complex protein FliE [Rhodanobacteraceae bacterium]
MTQPIAGISPASLVAGSAKLGGARAAAEPGTTFAATLDKALEHVSAAQDTAHAAARAEVTGAPGASLETALVASMRAHIDWTAAVAVRNGVVNAYNTVMNMPV